MALLPLSLAKSLTGMASCEPRPQRNSCVAVERNQEKVGGSRPSPHQSSASIACLGKKTPKTNLEFEDVFVIE